MRNRNPLIEIMRGIGEDCIDDARGKAKDMTPLRKVLHYASRIALAPADFALCIPAHYLDIHVSRGLGA